MVVALQNDQITRLMMGTILNVTRTGKGIKEIPSSEILDIMDHLAKMVDFIFKQKG